MLDFRCLRLKHFPSTHNSRIVNQNSHIAECSPRFFSPQLYLIDFRNVAGEAVDVAGRNSPLQKLPFGFLQHFWVRVWDW
jgi:hypothetical protein